MSLLNVKAIVDPTVRGKFFWMAQYNAQAECGIKTYSQTTFRRHSLFLNYLGISCYLFVIFCSVLYYHPHKCRLSAIIGVKLCTIIVANTRILLELGV